MECLITGCAHRLRLQVAISEHLILLCMQSKNCYFFPLLIPVGQGQTVCSSTHETD